VFVVMGVGMFVGRRIVFVEMQVAFAIVLVPMQVDAPTP
jgi:hypothetical protein